MLDGLNHYLKLFLNLLLMVYLFLEESAQKKMYGLLPVGAGIRFFIIRNSGKIMC